MIRDVGNIDEIQRVMTGTFVSHRLPPFRGSRIPFRAEAPYRTIAAEQRGYTAGAAPCYLNYKPSF